MLGMDVSELTYIGEGRTRKVYAIDDNWVLKVPRNDEGVSANQTEYNLYMCYVKNTELAACFLMSNGSLLMERVDCDAIGKPSWADFYDCSQVGKRKNGTWVAYDYGEKR